MQIVMERLNFFSLEAEFATPVWLNSDHRHELYTMYFNTYPSRLGRKNPQPSQIKSLRNQKKSPQSQEKTPLNWENKCAPIRNSNFCRLRRLIHGAQKVAVNPEQI